MRKWYTMLAVLLAVQFSFAQNVDPKLAELLQNALDSMHQILGTKGLGAAVHLPDGAIWAGGSGVSTTTPLDSIGPEHAFETGSSTKTITSMCILQLDDEGVLSIDDSLHTWVPNFTHINPNITIRQLLQHTSGIADVLQNPSFGTSMNQNVNQLWEFEDVISQHIQPPAFPPGTSWGYSNTNYLLLGMIVEAATGNKFHDELENRFFAPLGLDSYSNLAFHPEPEPIAHMWLDLNGNGNVDDAHNYFTSLHSTFSAVGPAGGYFARPTDLAKWMHTAMSGSLLSPELWEDAMQTISSGLPLNTKYGLGFMEQQHLGLTGYGHGGDLGGYNTRALHFPEKNLTITVCGNDANIVSWNLTNTVRALLKAYLDCEQTVSNQEEFSMTRSTAKVYPNPFTSWVNLSFELPNFSGPIDLSIFDENGTKVLGQTIHGELGENTIPLLEQPDLLPGTYYLYLESNGQTIETIPLIKIR